MIKKNTFFSRIISRITIINSALLIISSAFFLYPIIASASELNASTLIELTNKLRQENNLKILTPNHKLVQAAYRKAYDILKNGYFAHTNPSGKPFYRWIEEEGYNYLYAGENLAIDFVTSEGVFNAWVKSPSHRANLVNPNYNEIGLVTLRGHWQDHDTTVVVQTFGSLMSDSPFVLGKTLQNLSTDMRLYKNDLESLSSNLVFLPSLVGRDYFDVIVKTNKTINLALSNSNNYAVAQVPTTKVVQGTTYQTLLKNENSCCQNDVVFALTENKDGVNFTTPVSYPSLRDFITNYTLPAFALPIAPQDITFNFMLAGIILFLLLVAYKEKIKQIYNPNS